MASKEAAQLVFIESKHQKTIRLIDDEDIAEECHTWIHSQGGKITLLKFKAFIEEKLLIHSGSQKQDDHERPDILKYWQTFLDKIYGYEKYMMKYEGKNIEWIPLTLETSKKESGELPLRKKGNVRSIIVSEFLSEECGKDREGYWMSEHLIEQVKTKAILIFETIFSNCIALFAFDNSSNHAAFRSDALVASRMNLKPGGKQPKMRDTIFGPDNWHQSIVNKNNEPKGMKQILVECGLWKNGLNANYQLCLQHVVPTALESVNTVTIRKFARKAWRYMDLYRKGIMGKLAKYAAKKYKSHHCIPEYVLAELNKVS
ncbi:hypothetical protein C1645_839743 [Glomus cerebriforme]|uniref:Uncharacterized protein n=1 Tax=Glomus cerebriforme TaxID=658196 RepID=A0A397S7A5_9GLOM|nr:hypothetical protein C1645_839743 [Glomus cerebriforme]